jgi:hypothetical protein
MAPATPLPIQNALFAALTMASVLSVAMSPSTISMVSGRDPSGPVQRSRDST